MREFEYFLFENFDADQEADNPANPRCFLGAQADALLSAAAQQPPAISENAAVLQRLISGGVLRMNGTVLSFDCPVFLREDTAVLASQIPGKIVPLIAQIESALPKIKASCQQIDNGFPVEQNLYHILCGMIFDGHFFDYLSGKGSVATSRLHSSGLDYLTVIYEKCEELKTFSERLLCSYNRFANTQCSLQSFGDAQGDRFDLYRFFRLRERGSLPAAFADANQLLPTTFPHTDKDTLLTEVASLIHTGRCSPAVMQLLELFGYARGDRLCVPVFMPAHQEPIMEIEHIVESYLGEAMSAVLYDLADSLDITAVRHGVNRLEIANELYHIVFGSVNEELVRRGTVASPPFRNEEGRYLQCIEIYQ